MNMLAIIAPHVAHAGLRLVTLAPHLALVIAAAGPNDIPGLSNFITALGMLLIGLGVPLGTVGIALGAGMTAMGHHNGVHIIKTSIAATVIAVTAGGIAQFITNHAQ